MPKLEGGVRDRPRSVPDEAADEVPLPTEAAAASGEVRPVTRATLADQEDWLNTLWYGDGGTGKTSHLASAANQGKLILINAETGIKKRPLIKLGVNVANIVVVPDPASGEDLTYDLLDRLFWELKSDLESGHSEYVGVGWDSITEISKVVLSRISAKRAEKSVRTGKGSTDPFFTDLDDYRGMSEMMRPMVRHYRDLPCHFLATALERRDVDEEDSRVKYGPALSPALGGDVFGYVDQVIHTTVEEDPDGGDDDIFLGLTRPIGKYRAKDRLKSLPRLMAEPTFERIYGYVTETIEYDNDPVQAEAKARRSGVTEEKAPEKDEAE